MYGVSSMVIRARLTDGKEVEVLSYALDYLIATKMITAFLRSDGWVTIGEDKIRKKQVGNVCLLGNGERNTDNLFKRANREE